MTDPNRKQSQPIGRTVDIRVSIPADMDMRDLQITGAAAHGVTQQIMIEAIHPAIDRVPGFDYGTKPKPSPYFYNTLIGWVKFEGGQAQVCGEDTIDLMPGAVGDGPREIHEPEHTGGLDAKSQMRKEMLDRLVVATEIAAVIDRLDAIDTWRNQTTARLDSTQARIEVLSRAMDADTKATDARLDRLSGMIGEIDKRMNSIPRYDTAIKMLEDRLAAIDGMGAEGYDTKHRLTALEAHLGRTPEGIAWANRYDSGADVARRFTKSTPGDDCIIQFEDDMPTQTPPMPHTMPREFKPGDLVVTKMSGGSPIMTIERINPNKPGLLHVVWFDASQCLHRDAFDDFAIKHVVGMP